MIADLQIIGIVFVVCLSCIAGIVWFAKDSAKSTARADIAENAEKNAEKQMEIIHEQKVIASHHANNSKRDSINSVRASKHRNK